MDTSNRIAFLVGSGISRFAKMPMMEDITKAVVSNDGGKAEPRILVFLKRLKEEADRYYSSKEPGRSATYEELYFLVNQIFNSEWRQLENPAVQTLVDKIVTEVQPLLSPVPNERSYIPTLEALAKESMGYIERQVVRMLSKRPESTSYLGAITDGCKDADLVEVDIFTLNHDGILESSLQTNHVAYCDGFDPQADTIEGGEVLRRFNRELFQTTKRKVRVFKLHGSTDWFRYCPIGGNPGDEYVGNPRGVRIWGLLGQPGHLPSPIKDEPMILLGTINKMLSYSDGIFADLHWELDRVLRSVRQVVVSGYGFGDTGVNWRLIDWLFSLPNWRMIIIDPDPDKFQRAARWVRDLWPRWIREGNLKLLSGEIENTTWDEVRGSLCST